MADSASGPLLKASAYSGTVFGLSSTSPVRGSIILGFTGLEIDHTGARMTQKFDSRKYRDREPYNQNLRNIYKLTPNFNVFSIYDP